jgi:hypothetical protein
MIPHPPAINSYDLTHNQTLRFTANAAVAQVVTYQMLLDTLLCATTAVAGVDLFNLVRIRSIKVWAAAVAGQATTVSVEYGATTTGLVGDSKLHTDTSMSIEPAFVNARPTTKSLASNFQASSATQAFFLVCPSGAVIDCELSFKNQWGLAAVAAANALVAANIGSTYLRGLDGLAIATSKMLPIYSSGSI